MYWRGQGARLGGDNIPSTRWPLEMEGLKRRSGIIDVFIVPLMVTIRLPKHRGLVGLLDRKHGLLGLDWQQHRPRDDVQIKSRNLLRAELRDALWRQTVRHEDVVLQNVTRLVDVIVSQRRPDVACLHRRG